jgi:hypothetical protein
MPWQETLAKASYSSGRMKFSGGGDADIYSKPGRQTRVELRTSNIRADDQWKNVLIDVYYSVKEMRSNNTFLTWSGTAALPIPLDSTRYTVAIKDIRNYAGSWIVKGQVHDPLSLNDTANTVIMRGEYRIDGKGDDQDNAGFDIELAVPVRYQDHN